MLTSGSDGETGVAVIDLKSLDVTSQIFDGPGFRSRLHGVGRDEVS